MKCENCEKEIKEGMAFCPYCGKEVAPEPEPEPEIFYCPSCNSEIEPNMLFCPSCGYEISDNERKKFPPAQSAEMPIEENKKYCVVITGTKNVVSLVKLIREKTGLNLSMSQKLANNLPLPLFFDLSETVAKTTVVELEREGITATIQDSSCVSKNSNVTSDTQPTRTPTQTDTHTDRKEKLKTATVLSAVGAVLSVIVALCILLLPLFTSNYTETIDGESVLKEKSISMLVFVIDSIKSIPSMLSENTGAYAYLGFLYLFIKFAITIAVVSLIVSSVKLSVEKIKNLINFEEYSKRELTKDASARSAEELIKSFKGVTKGNTLFQVVFDLSMIIFIFGYGTIIWATIIAITVMASISYIIETIATWMKKKALA